MSIYSNDGGRRILWSVLLLFVHLSCCSGVPIGVGSVFSVEDVVHSSASRFMHLTSNFPSSVKELFQLGTRDSMQSGRSFSDKLSCLACKFAAKAAHVLIQSGAGEKEVARWGAKLCFKLGISTERVCNGICDAMKKEVVYVFSQAGVDPSFACSSILNEDCGYSSSESGNWTVTLPDTVKPPVVPVLPPKLGSPVLRVLHITDIHLDPQYTVGSKVDCGEFLCCRDSDGNGTVAKYTAGLWGDYRGCDTPLHSLKYMLSQISQTQKLDYILWTGDDLPHDIWNQTVESHVNISSMVSKLISSYFPLTPVFATVGNHEGLPVNSFPLPSEYNISSMSWLYTFLNENWRRWLPPETSTTILKGGFYSVAVFPGLRIISLNMNYCNSLNWWLLLNASDPLGQLHWLVNELQAAEDKGEKVHIVGHIPPGSYDCMKTWSFNYYRIVNRYENTIRGQFFGHTHVDDFEVFYDLNGTSHPRATNVAYIAPSVTTYDKMNPAYRIYTIDGNYSGSSWAVLDHETYYFNLSEANFNGKPKWYRLYSAKDAYGMISLQPEDWNNLIDKIENDDKLFHQFYRNYHRGSVDYRQCSTEACKNALLCNLRSGRSYDQSLCSLGHRGNA